MAVARRLLIGRDQRGKPFWLPLAAVSHTFALLAMRGAGKSNALVRLAEVMHAAGLPWVAIDPKGDWWGIRSSRDGKRPGLSIYVFGGLHGDVPLEPTAGAFMADLIFDNNLTCLLDVSQFSKGEQVRFLAEFAERLYRRHQTKPTPRHIFMEEAEEYIPQSFSTRTDGGYMARCVGAWSKIVKLGRAFGIGVTMATQRSASLNKNVLTQTESLILLRTPSPQDQAQIKGWVKYHSASIEIMESLSGLDNGEAWIVSPHVLKTVERITLDQRETFDSGATPELGQVLPQPSSRASIDLDVIRKEMAETIERIEATDPKKLQTRIRSLEIQLRQVTEELAKPRDTPEPEQVEVPVITDAQVKEVRETYEGLVELAQSFTGMENAITETANGVLTSLRTVMDWKTDKPRQAPPPPTPRRPGGYRAGAKTPAEIKPPPASVSRPQSSAQPVDRTLAKAEKQVLSCLATMNRTLSATQISQLTGRSSRSSAFKNALSSLRTSGLITGGRDAVTITDTGVASINSADGYDPLPTPGPDLVEWWRSNHLGRSEKSIIDVLMKVYPATLTKEEISEASGYSLTSSGFKNSLSRMRSFALIEGYDDIRVAPMLMGDG